MPRVAIVYRFVPHYRKPFYDGLRNELASVGIHLDVYYGRTDPGEAEKGDSVELEWGHPIDNIVIPAGRGRRLYWQACLRPLLRYDLVVVEQASKLLINYSLLLAQYLGGPKVALWGHGRNYQRHRASPVGERIKRITAKLPHWFFAYTDAGADIVRGWGFPDERLTVVQNSIDTKALVEAGASLSVDDLNAFREELGLHSENVALFIGGMYPDKRLSFLIEAAQLVRKSVPDFELLLAGSGTDAGIAKAASHAHSWIHYLGPQFGRRKAACFLVSKVLLMPGLVGLAVLDSFALETPLVTTAVEYHSPEIEYLRDGENGVVVRQADNVGAYAKEVSDIFAHRPRHQHLVEGCRRSRGDYSIEEMVSRFATGVRAALRAGTST